MILVKLTSKLKNARYKNILSYKLFLLLMVFVFSSEAFCAMPVIDIAAIIRMKREFDELTKQYNTMHDQLLNAKQQLDEAKNIRKNSSELISDSEGHYGYGKLYNSNSDTKEREWSADNWEDTLKGLSGGNPGRYKEILQQYQSNNKTLSEDEFSKGGSLSNQQIYKADVENNQAASVTASYAFDDIKNHIENIKQLSDQIENAPNEKSATDLNTRMGAEIAYTQVEMLKQLAVMNEQKAHEDQDTIKYKTAEAEFNKLPDY